MPVVLRPEGVENYIYPEFLSHDHEHARYLSFLNSLGGHRPPEPKYIARDPLFSGQDSIQLVTYINPETTEFYDWIEVDGEMLVDGDKLNQLFRDKNIGADLARRATNPFILSRLPISATIQSTLDLNKEVMGKVNSGLPHGKGQNVFDTGNRDEIYKALLAHEEYAKTFKDSPVILARQKYLLENMLATNLNYWLALDPKNWPVNKQVYWKKSQKQFKTDLRQLWSEGESPFPAGSIYHKLIIAKSPDPFDDDKVLFAQGMIKYEGDARNVELMAKMVETTEKLRNEIYEHISTKDFFDKYLGMLDDYIANHSSPDQLKALFYIYDESVTPGKIVPGMLKLLLPTYRQEKELNPDAIKKMDKILLSEIVRGNKDCKWEDLKSSMTDLIKMADSPEAIMRLYNKCVADGLIRGQNRKFAFWSSADRAEHLDDLKQQMYQLAVQSDNPAEFFNENMATLEPLIQKHHNEGWHARGPKSQRLVAQIQSGINVDAQKTLLTQAIVTKDTQIQQRRGPQP